VPNATLLRVRWETADAEGVLAVIYRQSLCVLCIVERSQISQDCVESILVALGEPLEIRRSLRPCGTCGQPQDVFRLG
jgi:hypothetical protein